MKLSPNGHGSACEISRLYVVPFRSYWGSQL